MFRFHKVGLAALMLALFANVASAQTSSGSDSVWNGALIGAGVGIGSAAALDAVFCDNGFGGCDAPWKAYLVLGGIGAGAGAGIDFLIGRNDQRRTTLRLAPILAPGRQGVRASLRFPDRGSLPAPATMRQDGAGERRDSVWNGTLIGAGIGAGSGYIWARSQCPHDTECFAIAGTVGIIGGAGIGAAVGAIADALHD